MSSSRPAPWLIHGWTIFAQPLFLSQMDAFVQQVEVLREKDPIGCVKKNANKRLAAITKLAFDAIPQDPTPCIRIDVAGESAYRVLEGR